VLTPQAVERLFVVLRKLAAEGCSILYISHKLHEIRALCTACTVMRAGRVTGVCDPREESNASLSRLMIGAEPPALRHHDRAPGDVVLDVRRLDLPRGSPFGVDLADVALQVRAGEVVGLAGVAGNGQVELTQVINGLRRCTQGQVRLNGKEITNRPVLQAIQSGMSYIPEDRTHVGSSPNLSITDNVIMKSYRQPPIAHGWVLDGAKAEHIAGELKDAYEIIAPTIHTPVRLLSGGNLQRVILAREISGHPTFIAAVQPTRGLDVGAIEGVHRLLLAQREAGAAILLVSEELEELFSLSDRILVIYEGRIMGEITGELDTPANVETIGLMMTGSQYVSGALKEEMNRGGENIYPGQPQGMVQHD